MFHEPERPRRRTEIDRQQPPCAVALIAQLKKMPVIGVRSQARIHHLGTEPLETLRVTERTG